MNRDLENIKISIEQSDVLSESEKENLINSIKVVDKELSIVEFKLERTEKVKRTTSVLLEETIDELEKKRADVEQANTALKKSLEELRSAQAQLIQSEKMASLGDLTAGIAHEIQNPLNFVNNFSEVNTELAEELNDEIESGNMEEAKDIARDIIENERKISHHGKRAEAIVKGMLQHSRTSTGKKESIDINALVDEYLRLAYHGLRAKDKSFNADFNLETDENMPKIKVIPQDIGRALLNLINNGFYSVDKKAKKGIEGYKPTVTLSINNIKTPSFPMMIEIQVKDNGEGIRDEIKEKIFQPFFTTKPTGSGTGLGLSLSYDIIKAHGGELKVDTKINEGTTFKITLPTNL